MRTTWPKRKRCTSGVQAIPVVPVVYYRFRLYNNDPSESHGNNIPARQDLQGKRLKVATALPPFLRPHPSTLFEKHDSPFGLLFTYAKYCAYDDFSCLTSARSLACLHDLERSLPQRRHKPREIVRNGTRLLSCSIERSRNNEGSTRMNPCLYAAYVRVADR